jgi:hypothetical protein
MCGARLRLILVGFVEAVFGCWFWNESYWLLLFNLVLLQSKFSFNLCCQDAPSGFIHWNLNVVEGGWVMLGVHGKLCQFHSVSVLNHMLFYRNRMNTRWSTIWGNFQISVVKFCQFHSVSVFESHAFFYRNRMIIC